MKTKTIILISWPLSVIFIGWFGCVMGVKFGMAEFHNDRVRRFQADVIEVAERSDARTRELLEATANLAGQMDDTAKYEAASETFAAKVKTLQNHAVEPTRALPGASGSH